MIKSRLKLIVPRVVAILLICISLGSILGLWRAASANRAYQVLALTDSDLAALDLSQVKHLMIVAHPDDETLWGGAHLEDGGYLVVCVTNGNHATRAAEFQSVMQASGNVGLILCYPDKVGGKRDNWSHIRTQLESDLERIILYQPWEDIVTHNAAGEYGHAHHKMTHQIVTKLYDQNDLQIPLFVFGKYYRAAVLPEVQDQLTPISEETLAKKEELLCLYRSQTTTADSLSHMNPYEMWTEIRGGGQHEATS